MSIRFGLIVAASLSLVACGGTPDEELAEEALTAEEAAGAAPDAAGAIMLSAGEYRTTPELLEFDMPSIPPAQMDAIRAAFAEGAAQGSTYCISDTMTREEWLSNMAESNCTASRFETTGGQIDAVMQCAGGEGVTGRVEMKGTTTADTADIEMTFVQAIPNMGEGTIRMRVKSERVGDCS